MRNPGAPPPSYPPGIRGIRLSYINAATSIVFTLPAGSLAGDRCLIFVTQGFNFIWPSGWVPLSYLTASNLKGGIIHKVLTSADITAGTVTINFGGTPYWGMAFGLTTIGALGVNSVAATNDNSGAPSRTVSTDANPIAADYMILFGAIDVNALVSSASLPTLLAIDAQTSASAIAKYGTAAAGGVQSATVNYAGSPTGDYQALVALSPSAVSTRYTNPGGTGNRSSIITVTAVNLPAGGGSPQDTVDGSQADSYWWANATGNGTAWLLFDFGVGVTKVIDQFLLYQSGTQSQGVWRFEGSNNNSTWSQCGVDFTLRPLEAIPVPNTTAYRYYRLRHMSGSRTQTPYIREFEFEIA